MNNWLLLIPLTPLAALGLFLLWHLARSLIVRLVPVRHLRRFLPEIEREVLDLILFDDDGWEADRHHFRHRRGNIDIWVANEAYGLHVAIRNRRLPRYPVTPGGSIKQVVLYRAFLQWQARRRSATVAAADSNLAQLIEELRRLETAARSTTPVTTRPAPWAKKTETVAEPDPFVSRPRAVALTKKKGRIL